MEYADYAKINILDIKDIILSVKFLTRKRWNLKGNLSAVSISMKLFYNASTKPKIIDLSILPYNIFIVNDGRNSNNPYIYFIDPN